MAWYYGSDSGTATGDYGSTFYIGGIGQGRSRSTEWALPKPSSKRAATYWNIEGPGSAPTDTYAQWGRDQATSY